MDYGHVRWHHFLSVVMVTARLSPSHQQFMSKSISIHPWRDAEVVPGYKMEANAAQTIVEVAMHTLNIHQCLRMCWLFTSCSTVTYLPQTQVSCHLFQPTGEARDKKPPRVPDASAVVVDMSVASLNKKRLYGCDTRPCAANEVCVTHRNQETFQCLPLISAVCGSPSQVPDATLSTDGLGFAYYRCREGFVSSPAQPVTSQCDTVKGSWSDVMLSCRHVDCGQPPPLGGATVTSDRTDFGASTSYICGSGHFSPSESMQIRCQESGHWSELPEPCTLVDCGQPIPVENGQVHPTSLAGPEDRRGSLSVPDSGTLYGRKATHSCLEGYYQSSAGGTPEVECQSNGQWSDTSEFQCTPVDCGSPPVTNYTWQLYNATSFGANVTYACLHGYAPQPGNDVISVCGHNGSWSSLDLVCSWIDCGTPEVASGFEFKFNTTLLDSEASLECKDSSHFLVGLNHIRCNQSGRWTPLNATCVPPPCATPTPLPHATVVTETEGGDHMTAMYTCDPGYVFGSGDEVKSIRCASNTWQTMDSLACLPVDCGEIPRVDNARPEALATTFGSSIVYTCHHGYRPRFPNATNERVCQENGTWSLGDVTCVEIVCNPPPVVEHTEDLLVLQHRLDDTVTYECVGGFVMATSNDTVKCTENGWEGGAGTIRCIQSECGQPPPVLNATRVVLDGGRVVYTCDDGTRLEHEGASTQVCQDGVWTGETVVCLPGDECPDPPLVDNATAAFDASQSGSLVTYKCQNGFHLTEGGSNQRMCQTDLSWSNETVVCEPDACGETPVLNNTQVTLSETPTGMRAEYRCKSGFKPPEILAQSERQLDPSVLLVSHCNQTSHWSGGVGTEGGCTPIDCGSLPEVEHSRSFDQDPRAAVGDVVVISCLDGFRLGPAGADNFTCGQSGTWQGTVECVSELCPAPREVQHARLVEVMRGVNGSAVYECYRGYEFSVNVTKMQATCQEDLTWSEVRGHCQAVDCSQPADVAHASVSVAGTTVNSTANYTCDRGFVPSPDGANTSAICEWTGSWTNLDVECVVDSDVTCPKPPSEEDSITMAVWGLKPGDVVTYQCRSDFIHWWFSSRTCLPNGTWTGGKIMCHLVDCGPPAPLVNGRIKSNNGITLESKTIYTCTHPYTISTKSTTRVCVSVKGLVRWNNSKIGCMLPGEKLCNSERNEMLNMWKFKYGWREGDVNEISCYSGYEFTTSDIRQAAEANGGVYVRTCHDGKWSGQLPSCRPKDCGDPPSVPNAVQQKDATTFGNTVTYTCLEGFVMAGHRLTRDCTADAAWTNDVIECVPYSSAHCPPPELRIGVEAFYKSHLLGSRLLLSCGQGFVQRDGQYECQDMGSWSPPLDQFTCQPMDCREPPRMEHTSRHFHLTTFGQEVVYTCNIYQGEEIFTRKPTKSVCQSSGKWSSVDHPCPKCGIPSDVPRTESQVISFDQTFQTGEVLSYQCLSGFSAFPPNTSMEVTCQMDGAWSSPESVCVLDACLAVSDTPGAVLNTTYRLDKDADTLFVSYQCAAGYGTGTDRSHTSICHLTNGWTPDNTDVDDDDDPCDPVTCDAIKELPGAWFAATGTTFESEALHSCRPGHVAAQGPEVLSVCQANGSWSDVHLDCLPCPLGLDVVVPNGRLEVNDVLGVQNLTSPTKGVVVCDQGFLLHAHSGPVHPEVTCVLDKVGGTSWEFLDNLTCHQSLWNRPSTRERFHLSQSYPNYSLCFDLNLPVLPVTIELESEQESELGTVTRDVAESQVVFAAVLGNGQVQLLQKEPSSPKIHIKFVPWEALGKGDHSGCVNIFGTDSPPVYELWLDDHHVGNMNQISTPVTDLNYFHLQGKGISVVKARLTAEGLYSD